MDGSRSFYPLSRRGETHLASTLNTHAAFFAAGRPIPSCPDLLTLPAAILFPLPLGRPGPAQYTCPAMSQPPFDIVGLGVIAVDEMLYAPHFPAANSKTRITERKYQGGGTVSCALAAAARLGSKCTVIGRLGDNPESDFCREHLPKFGIDLSRLMHDPAAGPVFTVIVVAADTGSRAIFGDYTHSRPPQPEELRPEWFSCAKVLLIDHLYPPVILAGAKMAKQLGLQVVSDIERDSPQFAETRQYIDHLVCSAEFSVPYTKSNSPLEACRALADSGDHATVVVTAGEKGCFWKSRGDRDIRHHPAHVVKPIDTTGCGDVFHGAFCHGVAAGWPTEKTIAWATAAAAIKAIRTGGWYAAPTPAEVEQMLNQGALQQ